MKKTMFLRKTEFLCGFICFAIAVIYLVNSIFIPRNAIVTLGAEFVPRIYGYALLLCSALLMIHAGKTDMESSEKVKMGKTDRINVLLVFVLLFCYIILINILGFIFTSVLYFFFQAILLAPAGTKHKFLQYIIISVILAVSTYYAFHNLFHISLPTGIFL